MNNEYKPQNWFLELAKQHTVSLIMASMGTLFTIFNLYIASQFTPLKQDLWAVNARISALESYRAQGEPLIERFLHLESKVSEIDRRGERIEDKLDRIIENKQ